MLSLPEALATIRAHSPLLPTTLLDPREAVGRILAADAVARVSMPQFANSAMDGICLRAEDVAQASQTAPVALPCVGRIAAGDPPGAQLDTPGTCLQIMTGAPLPTGADTILPIEAIRLEEGTATVTTPAPQGQHIRLEGEDFAAGHTLVPAGTRIGPFVLQALISAGVRQISAFKTLRLGMVSTGDEIVGDISQDLKPGQIYNSSTPMASAYVPEALGLEFRGYGTVGDDPADFQAVLDRMVADGCDICVSTGAVSAGVYDFVGKALADRGAEQIFHKIRLRPGKPNLFARLKEGPLYFGLPGNPVSSAAGLRFLVGEHVRAATGRGPEQPVMLPLLDPVTRSPRDLTQFLKARVEPTDTPHGPSLGVSILSGQQSNMIRPMVEQSAWAVVPEGVEAAPAGAAIAVYPLSPGGPLLLPH